MFGEVGGGGLQLLAACCLRPLGRGGHVRAQGAVPHYQNISGWSRGKSASED